MSLARPRTATLPDTWILPLTALLALGAALFVIRLTGAPNLLDNEFRVGAQVLDVLKHGNWLCPHDELGNTDKPPMLTWLAALTSWPLGRVTRFSLYLPTAVSTVLIAWLVLAAGGRWFTPRAGFLGGFAYLLSYAGAQQMASARWDGLFALTVALAALAAFRAWTLGRGWTWFWLAAAVSTLTKGPLGLVLAALGLGAVVWEGRGDRAKRPAGSHVAGIALFAVVTLGWFLLAYRQEGQHLVETMIRGELLGHVVEHRLGSRFLKPLGDFAANFAPWSLCTLVALIRIVAAPASDDDARRFERFLFCWFVGGVLVFCLSPHNQARLIAPMIPAAALLAGRELDRLAAMLSRRALTAALAAATVAGLACFTFLYHRAARARPAVRRTIALQRLVGAVRAAGGDDPPLTYVIDSPFAIQLGLNTMRRPVSYAAGAGLLRGEAAAFVVVRDLDRLRRALGAGAPPVFELAHGTDDGRPYVHVVGNRPGFDHAGPTAMRVGPFVVTLAGVGLGPSWDDRLTLVPGAHAGVVVVRNVSPLRRRVRVGIGAAAGAPHALGPGEEWRIDVAPAALRDGRARRGRQVGHQRARLLGRAAAAAARRRHQEALRRHHRGERVDLGP